MKILNLQQDIIKLIEELAYSETSGNSQLAIIIKNQLYLITIRNGSISSMYTNTVESDGKLGQFWELVFDKSDVVDNSRALVIKDKVYLLKNLDNNREDKIYVGKIDSDGLITSWDQIVIPSNKVKNVATLIEN